MEKSLHERSSRMFRFTPTPSSSRHPIRHFLEAMRRHDPGLIEHGKRTAIYSLILGRAFNTVDDELSDLYQAALLHDLGKLTLPNEVIQQNGLSMIGEYLMTECSPQAGADMLRPWPGLQRIAKIIALHHERWDGHGQPFGMRGGLIPLGARILSLTDTVDQLLTQKDDPIPDQIDTVVRILRTLSGTRFDPTVVTVFVDVCVPWIEGIGFQFTHDYHWAPKHSHPSSAPNFTGCTMLGGVNIPTRSRQGSSLDPHLKNILELTNPISYDSLPASVER